MDYRNRADEKHPSADNEEGKAVSRKLFTDRRGSFGGPYHNLSSLKLST